MKCLQQIGVPLKRVSRLKALHPSPRRLAAIPPRLGRGVSQGQREFESHRGDQINAALADVVIAGA